ncbi:TPA: NTPase KAP [Citrobacter amalonaticus]|uniref:KAP family P-loop NTPase fold protein n=1 Tax=Citrobacter amalonaticus TaxID=35703 RepID=UPI0028792B27|nr:P-loop NTPase fold protein [Citrobacter amalonaticus]MDS4036069.1 P-loop NTPase fold protein [Citrobacter amalonaticus]HED3076162.1 NTPase KAP [Citrobacter amalonaticus]HED3667538.1 NTPase KAP [Citrobacter amalonaticus]HED3696222.1 NTPase KAP [Citrobacter amalonaticus]HEM8621188.1 NTPase KAP [Citrobacter amalonaticus]
MDILWNWELDDEFLGEYLPKDTLDREKYAQYLYEICAARGEKSNLVININAEWGAGKTYFTKRLARTISNIHPTIYIDAWKEDFSEDPLLTVFCGIKDQLSNQSDTFTSLINSTIENVGPLLKTAAPVIIDGLIQKFTGVDSFSDLTKDLSSKLIEIHAEKASKIETVKKGISRWVEYIGRKDGIDKELPLFIIIDELDRCRPDFSISLLEISKHIFNIPGVVFIIATDTQQLQHSIKVIYGTDFSASHYLSRFFDRRFLLPTPEYKDLLLTKTGENIASEFDTLRDKLIPCPPDLESFASNCSSILLSIKINIRDAVKIYERLIDILISSNKKFDPNLMLILSAFNFKDHDIYAKIKSNEKLSPSPLNTSIDLSFDLSFSKTSVRCFRNSSGIYNNTYTRKEISTGVLSYIETAWNILILPRTTPPNTRPSNIPELWMEGELSNDESLSNFIKMGYAKSKYDKTELKIHQYFDLIELSTTFD